MKVKAKEKGFYGGKIRKEDETFNLKSRLEEKASDAKHKADVKDQFSEKWMEEVK